MNFLLDTNVVSEWVRPQPDRNVISWLAEVDEDRNVKDFQRLGISLLDPWQRG